VAGIPRFTSVPGQLVPGMGQPALIAAEPLVTTYPYYGHMVLYYLDYLDVATQKTLVALPGGSYLMTPVNSRHGLTIPPPDGRWTIGTVRDLFVFGPRIPTLAEARAAIGPGFIPPPLIPRQREAPVTAHPAGSAAWDREAHRRRVILSPPPSLREARAAIGPGPEPEPAVRVQPGEMRGGPPLSLTAVRARIEAAKAERGFRDTAPAAAPPAPAAAMRVMPPPEPTELQRIRAALAAKAAAVVV
jgi:hypothetical protein